MSGLTMGYGPGGEYTASSARKFGEWTDIPDPVFTGSSAVTHVYETVDGYGTKQFDNTGRRPYSVSILNDRGADIFFLFEKQGTFMEVGDNQDDASITTFEMSPIAWSGSHADSTAGDVLFLYRGDQ